LLDQCLALFRRDVLPDVIEHIVIACVNVFEVVGTQYLTRGIVSRNSFGYRLNIGIAFAAFFTVS